MPDSAPSTERTVVHLVRHGEVDNPTKVLYGRLADFHLSELGHRMAGLAAEHLADRDVTHLVSSPLERAQETMQPLADAVGLPVTLDERVIEAGNDFEGRTVGSDPKQLLHPRFWVKLRNPLRPSWGEPYAHIAARMSAAIDDARDAARGHEAVIVSHQLPVWTARRHYEGKRLWHDPRKRECALASVTSLTFVGDDVVSLSYAEPAASLLPQASKVAGA
ncbi:histidine phosphatase family protein [Luteipulveratus sp. YIM 133132]|uniref:histidine phosphatase family protein n=1 Tax=Luteipulveratus flavus TaxID=3031728 RepID=UPI0023AE742E|nr:histidine phosphatase family protein [Luteipulveratus sp. YIM 133132]MDE9365018.1 histidine phosphatase family protein [Luteipulveratus sp. YIM 133132]